MPIKKEEISHRKADFFSKIDKSGNSGPIFLSGILQLELSSSQLL